MSLWPFIRRFRAVDFQSLLSIGNVSVVPEDSASVLSVNTGALRVVRSKSQIEVRSLVEALLTSDV